MSSSPSSACIEHLQKKVSLEELFQRGEHYALLNAALAHLQNDPQDSGTALLAFRSYTSLGLVGPACDMLADGALTEALPELHDLKDQMGRMPTGRIPWESLADRFEKNAARLYRSHPHLRRHDEVFRRIPRELELYRTLDGNFQLSACSPESPRRWVPDLCNTKRLVANSKPAHDPADNFCCPYVIIGDRFGAMFDRFHALTRKMFMTFSPRIYVVEPDVRSFGVRLYVCETVQGLCEPRTTILLGPDFADALTALFDRHPHRAIPKHIARLPPLDPALLDRLAQTLHATTEARERRALVTVGEVKRHYEPSNLARPSAATELWHVAQASCLCFPTAETPVPPACDFHRLEAGATIFPVPQVSSQGAKILNVSSIAHWARRFDAEAGGGLRVLGLTSRFTTVLQYSMRDLKAAFEARGHAFRLLIEQNDHDLLTPFHTAEAIRDFRPDLILVIDHLRRKYTREMPSNIPFVCWIQDSLPHLTCTEAGRSMGPLDFFIAPVIDPYVRQYGYPAEQGLAWTMATNERVFDAEALPPEALAPYRCDVSFVSNQSQTPEAFHAERGPALTSDPAATRLTAFLFEHLRALAAENPAALCGTANVPLAQAKRETGIALETPEAEDKLARFYVQPMAELLFRQGTLAWVADHCDRTGRTLHLYGRGWEDHPRFKRYARGVAENGLELRAIYQASRINLQVSSYGAIHQRLLDGLASGGFFLIRQCPVDTLGEPLQAFAAAVERYNIQPEREYRAEEVPELASSLRALATLYGDDSPGPRIRLPAWRLEYYCELAAKSSSRIAGVTFAEYGDVAFASSQAFERLADRYHRDDGKRASISAAMRQTVLARFTYGALVDELLSFIARRLAANAT